MTFPKWSDFAKFERDRLFSTTLRFPTSGEADLYFHQHQLDEAHRGRRLIFFVRTSLTRTNIIAFRFRGFESKKLWGSASRRYNKL